MTTRQIRSLRLAAGAIAVALIAACTDSRIRALEVGMKKDSVFKLIGQGAPAGDSLPNVYRRVQYFVDSKFFDIFLFDAQNRKSWEDPLVADGDLTPVVLVGDSLVGFGWDYADELTSKYSIQLRTDLRK